MIRLGQNRKADKSVHLHIRPCWPLAISPGKLVCLSAVQRGIAVYGRCSSSEVCGHPSPTGQYGGSDGKFAYCSTVQLTLSGSNHSPNRHHGTLSRFPKLDVLSNKTILLGESDIRMSLGLLCNASATHLGETGYGNEGQRLASISSRESEISLREQAIHLGGSDTRYTLRTGQYCCCYFHRRTFNPRCLCICGSARP